jgi:hypothetical protein
VKGAPEGKSCAPEGKVDSAPIAKS